LRQLQRDAMTISLAGKRGAQTMAQVNMRLRLESENGLETQEYRVDDGEVEVRSFHPQSRYALPESSWHRLTRQQLRSHVERNTVVAQWLEHRMGWRRLLQACVSQQPHEWTPTEGRVDVDMDRDAA